MEAEILIFQIVVSHPLPKQTCSVQLSLAIISPYPFSLTPHPHPLAESAGVCYMAGQERGWLAANRQTWYRVAHGASTCRVVGIKEGPLEARQTMLFMLLSQEGMEKHTHKS